MKACFDKYNFVVVDWKEFDESKKGLIDMIVLDDKKLILAIKEYELNPRIELTPLEVMSKIMEAYPKKIKDGSLKVMVIPNICTVSYLSNNHFFFSEKI